MTNIDTMMRPQASTVVARPRLLEGMRRIRSAGTTAILAPAGYGKTALLAAWHRHLQHQGLCVARGAVRVGQHDPASFLLLLDAMLAPCGPAIDGRAGTLQLVQARLAALPVPAVLLLDDIHVLDAGASLLLAGLLDQLPEGVHVVTASRQAPPPELGRSQGRAGLAQLDHRDLRFTPAEVDEWLRQAGLDPAEGALLTQRTEGWGAGLALALDGLARSADPAAFVAGFSGGNRSVHRYFMHDVMAALPESLHQFLLATCVPDRLCAELCDALTGRADGQDMLDRLEERGLFVQHLDDERVWYRYHGLFAAFLRRHQADTRAGAAATAHRRASRWHRARNQHAQALQHAAQAGDAVALAALLDEVAEPLILGGDGALVGQHAASLSDDVIAGLPRLLLAQAWLHTAALQCDDAAGLLRRAEAAIGRLDPEAAGKSQTGMPGRGELTRMLRHQRLLLAAAADDPEQTECRARGLQGETGDAKPYIALTVNALLILAQREQFNFREVETAAALARVGGKRWPNGPHSLILHAALAPALFATGATEAAASLLEGALGDCARSGPALAAVAALPLAEIAFERHDLHRARSLLDEYLS
ncbi:MAG: hypothetical protein ACRYGM_11425, partial [Janthinobacterium lividum]